MKTFKNVKNNVEVGTKIMKLHLLHDLSDDTAAFHLDLQCLQKYLLWGTLSTA